MKGPVNPNRLAVGAVAAVAALLGGSACGGGPCVSSISTDSQLPTGAVGAAYFFPLEVGNDCGKVFPDSDTTWALAEGNLPSGLRLSSGGDIDGVPATAGEFSFLVEVRLFKDDPDNPAGSILRDVIVKTFFLTIDPTAP